MKAIQLTRTLAKIGALSGSLAVASLLVSQTALAERITIPLGQQGKAWNVESPRTGLRKDQVEAQFGSPESSRGPVGDPPIYTWEYPTFIVYFEGDYVIHSVVKHQPQATQ